MNDTAAVAGLLLTWIGYQADDSGRHWLHRALVRVATGGETELTLAFALAARRVGKADLVLTPADEAAAAQARPGWHPRGASLDQAARALLLLAAATADADVYATRLARLFRAGDLHEQCAILRALPLLPHAEAFIGCAAAGVRANASVLLEAIAFDNPYPAEYFDQAQWNGMVLKCLFHDLPVERVIGLEARMNAELARMVGDLIAERRAGGRSPPADAGRFVSAAAGAPAADVFG